jgi:hypothetical protein
LLFPPRNFLDFDFDARSARPAKLNGRKLTVRPPGSRT